MKTTINNWLQENGKRTVFYCASAIFISTVGYILSLKIGHSAFLIVSGVSAWSAVQISKRV